MGASENYNAELLDLYVVNPLFCLAVDSRSMTILLTI